MLIETPEVVELINEYAKAFDNHVLTLEQVIDEVAVKFKKVHEHACYDRSEKCEAEFLHFHFINLGATIAMRIVERVAED